MKTVPAKEPSGDRISPYQPEQKGLIFPQQPVFESAAAAQLHQKQRLVASCRAFAHYGIGFGFGGHLTIRDAIRPDHFWSNPMAIPFSQVKLSNIVLVNLEGEVVEGRYAINRAGYVFHAAVYRGCPDIVAMAHAHTNNCGAWSAFGRHLDPINQDACAFYGDQALISEDGGAAGLEESTGSAIASAIGTKQVVIHQNHGIFTVSRHSIDDAAFRFLAVDRQCEMQMKVEATGFPAKWVSPEKARYTFEHIGNSYFSWLNFETLYQEVLHANPDMFD